MNRRNGRNVEKRYKCMLLGTILYLYVNTLAIVVNAQSIQPQHEQYHHHHQQQHQQQQQKPSDERYHQREQIPLVRLPSNTLLKYTAYKDVSILHFHIPTDTRTAHFNFKAYEETKSAFRKLFFLFYFLFTAIFFFFYFECSKSIFCVHIEFKAILIFYSLGFSPTMPLIHK